MGTLQVSGNSRTRSRLTDASGAVVDYALATGGVISPNTSTLVTHTFSSSGTFALINTGLLPVDFVITGTATFGGASVSGSTNVISNTTVTITSGTVAVSYNPNNFISGGTVTISGGYAYHTFTGAGTFTPGSNVSPLPVDYIIVGGGGGGGRVIQGSTTMSTAQAVTIGGAGTGGTTASGAGGTGTAGGNSVLGSIGTAEGGGIGGGGADSYAATTGGSGGGGSGNATNSPHAGAAAGSALSSAGGQGAGGDNAGGGGGGANAAGTSSATTSNGGAGYTWLDGVVYGSGGGGGRFSSFGAGGSGAGNGGTDDTSGTAGTANRGGGGGGAGNFNSHANAGGNGGSGVVVVRYFVGSLRLQAAIMALSPLGYWMLNEASGTTATDKSGNARNGTYQGTGYTLQGATGGDGATYVDLGNGGNSSDVNIADDNVWSLSSPATRTFFTLIKPDSVAGTTALYFMSKGSASNYEWGLNINEGAGGRLVATVWTAAGAAINQSIASSPITTAWQAIAVVLNASAIPKLFRNNNTDATTSSLNPGGTATNQGAAVQIGWRADSPASGYFQGGQAHQVVFSGELTPTQIQTLMTAADLDGWF